MASHATSGKKICKPFLSNSKLYQLETLLGKDLMKVIEWLKILSLQFLFLFYKFNLYQMIMDHKQNDKV